MDSDEEASDCGARGRPATAARGKAAATTTRSKYFRSESEGEEKKEDEEDAAASRGACRPAKARTRVLEESDDSEDGDETQHEHVILSKSGFFCREHTCSMSALFSFSCCSADLPPSPLLCSHVACAPNLSSHGVVALSPPPPARGTTSSIGHRPLTVDH